MAHRRPLAFVLPAALALAAGAAIGYAAAPSAPGAIGACYVLGGSVRVVAQATDCHTGTGTTPAETFVSLKLQGGAGPQFVTRFKTSATDRTKHKQVTRQCQTGETAIAGSAQLHYPKSTPTPARPVPLFVTDSRPLPAGEASPTGWLIVADAIARYSRAWSVQVNVTCAAPPA